MKFNLKEVRKRAGFTQQEVANITNIALGTLRRWEQGINEPDMESVIRLAKLYGVSTDTLLGSPYGEDLDSVEKVSFTGFSEVPVYGSIAAGVPLEMIEIDETHPIPEPMHQKYPNAFLLRVSGESMNRCIPNGSYVLVNPTTEVINGEPYAVCVNGDAATIKRVVTLNNGFMLEPDSTDPTFKPVVYDYGVPDTQQVTIIGRVVWYVLPFDYKF